MLLPSVIWMMSIWLSKGFGEDVPEHLRLRVTAKRYLCAMDKEYLDRLSLALRQSLVLQGGLMNEFEAREFEALSYNREGILVRQWDDRAKEVGLKVPERSYYQTFLAMGIRVTVLLLFIFIFLDAAPQNVLSQHSGRQPGAKRAPLALRSPVQDKNFYLLSLFEMTPEIRRVLKENAALQRLAAAKRERLATSAATCEADTACHLDAMRWQEAEIQVVQQSLRELYRRQESMRRLVDVTMRESGMFQRYHARVGEELLCQAWSDAAAGINNLIDVYGGGRAPRYPAIDAAMYDVKSDNYRRLINITVNVLNDRQEELELFFHPPLRFGLSLLEINRRDEAGRFEPLHLGENRSGLRRIATIRWKDYPYSAIIVPGSGTDRLTLNFSPWGKMRLMLAAKRFREKKAPFIIVSGGFVHPNQTPFCEAVEMKKVLINDFGVAADSILIDPHARHTTTNLRNASRLIYRYGIPFDKAALITTDNYQSRYIESAEFMSRCDRELGYQPHKILARLSAFDMEFMPNLDSLQSDALDPLDP